MSVEDDMIEYGFWDGNDYMDYLMNESDRVDNEMRRREALAEDEEKWLESLSQEEIEELYAEEEQMKKEEREKREKVRQKKMKQELEYKQWIIDYPSEAKVWFFIDYPSLSNDVELLGTEDKNYFWKGYKEWVEWKKERYYYLKFKNEYSQEWRKWKKTFLISYLKKSIESFFLEEKTDVLYKYFCKWRDENKSMWDNLRRGLDISKSEEDYELQAWLNHYKWHDTYRVWKVIDKDIWEKEKKRWTVDPEKEEAWILNDWQREHNQTWHDWKNVMKDILNEWKAFLCNLSDFLSEKADDDDDLLFDVFESYFVETYSDRENSDEKKIDLFENLKMAYEDNLRDPQYICDFLNKNKVEILTLNYDIIEEFVDRMAMCLWIKRHKNQWQKWKIKKMWHHCYKDRCFESKVFSNTPVVNIRSIILYRNLDYPPIIYFNVWKSLYPQKWKNWKNCNFGIWKQKDKELNIWKTWIDDNNEWTFDEFANNNIEEWDIFKDNSLSEAMQCAYEQHCYERRVFNTYGHIDLGWGYKEVFENLPRDLTFFRSTIREWVLIDQFNFEITNNGNNSIRDFNSDKYFDYFISAIKHDSYTHIPAVKDIQYGVVLETTIDVYHKLLALFSNFKCLIVNEILKWERLSDSIYSFCMLIVDMGYKNLITTNRLLEEKIDEIRLKKDLAMQLELFLNNHCQSLSNLNVPSVIDIYSEVIDVVYNKNKTRYGAYKNYLRAKDKIIELESLFEEWIATRKSISCILDKEKVMYYDKITKNVIEELCNLLYVEKH